MCDPEFLGYHLLSGSELSTQVVSKRTPRDNVGNVVSIDGKLRIIEYSDLNPLDDEIVCRRSADGTPVFWAGNTAIHVFNTAFLERAAAAGSALPFHVAKKAVSSIDSTGRRVEAKEPNAIKFERFIFDLLPLARQALVVEVDPAEAFAPVKNSDDEPTDNPRLAKAAMMAQARRRLREAGVQIADHVPVEINPIWAGTVEQIRQRLKTGTVITEPTYFSPTGPKTLTSDS